MMRRNGQRWSGKARQVALFHPAHGKDAQFDEKLAWARLQGGWVVQACAFGWARRA